MSAEEFAYYQQGWNVGRERQQQQLQQMQREHHRQQNGADTTTVTSQSAQSSYTATLLPQALRTTNQTTRPAVRDQQAPSGPGQGGNQQTTIQARPAQHSSFARPPPINSVAANSTYQSTAMQQATSSHSSLHGALTPVNGTASPATSTHSQQPFSPSMASGPLNQSAATTLPQGVTPIPVSVQERRVPISRPTLQGGAETTAKTANGAGSEPGWHTIRAGQTNPPPTAPDDGAAARKAGEAHRQVAVPSTSTSASTTNAAAVPPIQLNGAPLPLTSATSHTQPAPATQTAAATQDGASQVQSSRLPYTTFAVGPTIWRRVQNTTGPITPAYFIRCLLEAQSDPLLQIELAMTRQELDDGVTAANAAFREQEHSRRLLVEMHNSLLKRGPVWEGKYHFWINLNGKQLPPAPAGSVRTVSAPQLQQQPQPPPPAPQARQLQQSNPVPSPQQPLQRLNTAPSASTPVRPAAAPKPGPSPDKLARDILLALGPPSSKRKRLQEEEENRAKARPRLESTASAPSSVAGPSTAVPPSLPPSTANASTKEHQASAVPLMAAPAVASSSAAPVHKPPQVPSSSIPAIPSSHSLNSVPVSRTPVAAPQVPPPPPPTPKQLTGTKSMTTPIPTTSSTAGVNVVPPTVPNIPPSPPKPISTPAPPKPANKSLFHPITPEGEVRPTVATLPTAPASRSPSIVEMRGDDVPSPEVDELADDYSEAAVEEPQTAGIHEVVPPIAGPSPKEKHLFFPTKGMRVFVELTPRPDLVAAARALRQRKAKENAKERAVANDSHISDEELYEKYRHRHGRYPCRWAGCGAALDNLHRLSTHLKMKHATFDTVNRDCLWTGCRERSLGSVHALRLHVKNRHVEPHGRCPFEDCHFKGTDEAVKKHIFQTLHDEDSTLRLVSIPEQDSLKNLPQPAALPIYPIPASAMYNELVVPCPISKGRHSKIGPELFLKMVYTPLGGESLHTLRRLAKKPLGARGVSFDEYDFLHEPDARPPPPMDDLPSLQAVREWCLAADARRPRPAPAPTSDRGGRVEAHAHQRSPLLPINGTGEAIEHPPLKPHPQARALVSSLASTRVSIRTETVINGIRTPPADEDLTA